MRRYDFGAGRFNGHCRIQEIDNTLPIVVMNAGQRLSWRRSNELCARDFAAKAWDNERLLTIVAHKFELPRRCAVVASSKPKIRCSVAACQT